MSCIFDTQLLPLMSYTNNMNFSDPVYWDDYYRNNSIHKMPWAHNGQRLIDEVLSKGNVKTALDVGCGVGFKLHYLLSKGIDAYGIDCSATAIAKACTNRALLCDMRDIEVKDELNRTYDLILDLLSSHFVVDRQIYFKWVVDHLYEGAYYVLIQFLKHGQPAIQGLDVCDVTYRYDVEKPTIKIVCKKPITQLEF